MQADALVLLSDVEGLYTAPPSAGGVLIPEVRSQAELGDVTIGGTGAAGVGRGGMATKVVARVTFDGKGGAKMAERWDVGFRVRDLAVAADGSVWLVEDAFPGGLYKLTKK